MKIIFLDIDGVLNSRAYDRTRDRNAQTNIDVSRLPLIKEIVDATDAKIVLSSSWRQHWDKEKSRCDAAAQYIDTTFAEFGLTIYDKTPDFGINASRSEEITKWLQDAKETVGSFVIIDDYPFGWGELSAHYVKTDPNFRLGIEKEHVEQAIAILNKKGTK